MKTELLTLAKYRDAELARPMAELLNKRGIPFELEDASAPVDVTFSASPYFKEYHLKVPKTYYKKALKIWEADSEALIEKVDKHHYLFKFSDEELREILEKSDEWSKEDYVLAKKILADRGQEVSEKELAVMEALRIAELSKPAKADPAWIFLGYALALIGGFAGILIGYNYRFKKTLPNGTQVFAYDEASRKQGKQIFYLGLIMFILSAGLGLLTLVLTKMAMGVDV